jgi:hypothetical protein
MGVVVGDPEVMVLNAGQALCRAKFGIVTRLVYNAKAGSKGEPWGAPRVCNRPPGHTGIHCDHYGECHCKEAA